MELVSIAQIAFAAAAILAAVSLAAAAADRLSRRVLLVLEFVLGALAVAAWVAFGFEPQTSLAVPAGGITLAFAAVVAAAKLRELLRGAHRIDEQLLNDDGICAGCR